MQTRKWEKEGVTRYSTEIIADQMQMLGSREGGSNTYEVMDEDQSYSSSQASSSASTKRPAQSTSPTKPAASGSNFDDFDDDIPF